MKKNSVYKGYTGIFLAVIVCLLLTSPTVAGNQRMAVKAPLANIRSGPGSQYPIIWKVEKFFPILILETSGKWYRFKDFEGDQGWIHKSLVGSIPAVITRAETCYVRSGPGPDYNILFSIGSGIPFKVLKKHGKWLQVQHADGDSGWIYDTVVW